MAQEAEILRNLFSNWISLALEYASGAPDVRAVYVYASSEGASSFTNVYFDQAGTVVSPGKLAGVDAALSRVGQVQDLLTADLFAAEDALKAADVPPPTEYRVYYEVATRKLDSQLSRELIYSNDADRIPERGIEYWLGDRAPKLF